MPISRQFNFKGQMRVDVPHLRMLESGVVNDFDTLAGQSLTGANPYILKGFSFSTGSWVAGDSPADLELVTAGGVMFNYGASENGTMLYVPSDRSPETLSVSNSRVIGGFTANGPNYIGVDYIRLEDSSTSDVVQFVDAATFGATPKVIPLGRTLDYRIYISTVPFSTTPQLCPVAIVTTDANNLIASIEDARTMYFRLAAGGDSPNPLGTYSWPEGRLPEDPTLGLFTGGDKSITNEKDWKSAVMHRLWEVTGGEHWYSDVTDRNMKFYSDGTQHTRAGFTGPLIWDGTNVTWVGLAITFDNSTAVTNTVDDQAAASPGLTDMADGDVIYVEVNRYVDGTALAPLKVTRAQYNALPAPTRVGSRYIIFWRVGTNIYSRLDYREIGWEFNNIYQSDAQQTITPVVGGHVVGAGTDYAGVGSGQTNTVSADYSRVGGGDQNAISSSVATYSTIAGGRLNSIASVTSAACSTISGGNTNTISAGSASYATIGGGRANEITSATTALGTSIVGGDGNVISAATANYATIGGGLTNLISAATSTFASIVGGNNNQITGVAANATGAAVGGGSSNVISGTDSKWSTIAGGFGSSISGADSKYATIGGGLSNVISAATAALAATIGGGLSNAISAADGTGTTISGGDSNQITSPLSQYATISGGNINTITSATIGSGATICGGVHNDITAAWAAVATIGGGQNNLISAAIATYATICGGYDNTITSATTALAATIGGGRGNDIAATNGDYATIAGGYNNVIDGATGTQSFIGGGSGNHIASSLSVIGGGGVNHTTALYSTIGGGYANHAEGEYSTIPGGIGAKTTMYGEHAIASGYFSSPGDAQVMNLVSRAKVDTAGIHTFYLDPAAGEGTLELTMSENSQWRLEVDVLMNTNSATAAEATNTPLKAVLYRQAGNAVLIGVAVPEAWISAGGPFLTLTPGASGLVRLQINTGTKGYAVAHIKIIQVIRSSYWP